MFLDFDLQPRVGGPGFTVGFIADITGSGATIPPTPAAHNRAYSPRDAGSA